METSQSLATESFSYSWLTNKHPSSHYLNTLHESLLKETNFEFDILTSINSSTPLVHADEIFFNGQIIPFYNVEESSNSTSLSVSSSLPITSISSVFPRSCNCHFLEKWRKSSKKMLEKWIGFVVPFCKRVGFSRKSIRVDDIEMKVDLYRRRQSWSDSTQESSSQNPSNAMDFLCDIENPIYDAVLHCKRSIGI
ncbi:hypothetical protein LguiA_019061 [Lonicera macranthoides]